MKEKNYCPDCGSEKTVSNSWGNEIVCRNCGVIYPGIMVLPS